jgi:hypothetical protein
MSGVGIAVWPGEFVGHLSGTSFTRPASSHGTAPNEVQVIGAMQSFCLSAIRATVTVAATASNVSGKLFNTIGVNDLSR